MVSLPPITSPHAVSYEATEEEVQAWEERAAAAETRLNRLGRADQQSVETVSYTTLLDDDDDDDEEIVIASLDNELGLNHKPVPKGQVKIVAKYKRGGVPAAPPPRSTGGGGGGAIAAPPPPPAALTPVKYAPVPPPQKAKPPQPARPSSAETKKALPPTSNNKTDSGAAGGGGSGRGDGNRDAIQQQQAEVKTATVSRIPGAASGTAQSLPHPPESQVNGNSHSTTTTQQYPPRGGPYVNGHPSNMCYILFDSTNTQLVDTLRPMYERWTLKYWGDIAFGFSETDPDFARLLGLSGDVYPAVAIEKHDGKHFKMAEGGGINENSILGFVENFLQDKLSEVTSLPPRSTDRGFEVPNSYIADILFPNEPGPDGSPTQVTDDPDGGNGPRATQSLVTPPSSQGGGKPVKALSPQKPAAEFRPSAHQSHRTAAKAAN